MMSSYRLRLSLVGGLCTLTAVPGLAQLPLAPGSRVRITYAVADSGAADPTRARARTVVGSLVAAANGSVAPDASPVATLPPSGAGPVVSEPATLAVSRGPGQPVLNIHRAALRRVEVSTNGRWARSIWTQAGTGAAVFGLSSAVQDRAGPSGRRAGHALAWAAVGAVVGRVVATAGVLEHWRQVSP